MKKLSKEQVIKILKSKASKINSMEEKPWKYRRMKAINYRNIAGKYKPSVNMFVNHSGAYYFDPSRLVANSYEWWSMLRVVNGKLVRNDCNYSMSTARHQDQLDDQLKILGIKPDITVSTRANIKHMGEIQFDDNIRLAELIVKLENAQKKSIPSYKKQIKDLKKLMEKMQSAKIGVRFTKKDAKKFLESERSDRLARLERKRPKPMPAPIEEKPLETVPYLKLVK